MLAESPRFKHVKYLSLDFFLNRVKGIKCQRLRDIENVHFPIKFLKYLFAIMYQINETNKDRNIWPKFVWLLSPSFIAGLQNIDNNTFIDVFTFDCRGHSLTLTL